MALTLNETNISDNPQFAVMLTNLQANILKGHGRNFAHHLFFQIKNDADPANLKDWMAQFASQRITTAKKQLEDTAALHAGTITDGGPVLTLSLTAQGYQMLGLEASMPQDAAFNAGMQASAGLLLDDPLQWEQPFAQTIHLLIIVADDNCGKAQQISNDIINEMTPFAQLLHNQKGNVLKMKGGTGIEHFGYADGISQPLYTASDISQQPSTIEWDDTTALNLVLVPEPGTEGQDLFGSYFVFRKLEQNVRAFKDAEGDNSVPGVLPVIKDASGNDNPELAGAMLVGRFESGTPVVKNSVDMPSNPATTSNDFSYADDLGASKCPFHAHTRLMNPRKGDTIAGQLNRQRITRRGMPYDEVGRIAEADITRITDEMLDANQPKDGVGLLFMCYQSSIQLQFEILQAHWANEGQIAAHQVGAQDSIIGQGTNPSKTLPAQWGHGTQTSPFGFSGFVKMKGGEYFFTPSISFLANQATLHNSLT